MYLILNGHQDTAVWVYKYKIVVIGNKEGEMNFRFTVLCVIFYICIQISNKMQQ
jgi:hypothetical protein